MDFKDYITKVKSLRPGTEGNLKVQRERRLLTPLEQLFRNYPKLEIP